MANIAITLGDPAGVGPDVIAHVAQQVWPVPLVVIGDAEVLMARAQVLGLSLTLKPYVQGPLAPLNAGELYCHSMSVRAAVVPGQLCVENAPFVLDMLRYAGEGCLRGEFAAMVTAPLHKGVINDTGVPFSGHTEYLAKLAGVARVVMMLMTPQLKVALVTTHLPLRQVPEALTPTLLRETLTILRQDLRAHFGLEEPRIAVCGLNPHAGEGGHLGKEEEEVISPVLQACRQQGWAVSGPWPADTVFTEPADVILAMYHDQGLPMVKFSDFHRAVNVTLGLPFVRTSVDHGTALSLAGTGKAHPGSMLAATQLAMTLTAGKTR